MAEIATIAGVAITIPGILSAAWTVLKAAYDLYGNVDRRREQLRLLLDRCAELIRQISEHIQAHPDASGPTAREARALEEACQAVKDIVDPLSKKGFVWGLIHQDKIDKQINVAQSKITDVFGLFNVFAHLDAARFREDLSAAQKHDQADLTRLLNNLSSNDERILNAIQDQNGVQKRMEDVLIAILKHVQDRPVQRSPEDTFLRSARDAVQRMSWKKNTVPSDWLLSSLEVDYEQNESNMLGRGSFGKIFKGEWNGAIVAIKQMHVEDARAMSEADREVLLKEVKIWIRLQHPNVLNLYGACLDATIPFLVMRHCKFGNTRDYLQTHPEADRLDIVYDIIAGLTYLHSKNIVHADLKGVNVLIGDDEHAVLTDFGLSIAIDDIRSRSTASKHTSTSQGTLRWMAPECLEGGPSTKAADIYAFGITVWEIFSGEVPFANIRDRLLLGAVVDRQKRPERPIQMAHNGLWRLVQQCWAAEPSVRPNTPDVQFILKRYAKLRDQGDFDGQPIALPSNHDVAARSASPAKDRQPLGTLHQSVTPRANTLAYYKTQSLQSTYTPRQPSISSSQWNSTIQTHKPTWKRGNPRSYIDSLTFPQTLADKAYGYRVVTDDNDLGIRPSYEVQKDGSQNVNLLEYNEGYGVHESIPIRVYAVDPDDHGETLVAQWNPR